MKKVYIEWFDAYTHDPWLTYDDAREYTSSSMVCKTIGWLLDSDKKHITICHTRNPQMVMGSLHIPRKCIKKLKVL